MNVKRSQTVGMAIQRILETIQRQPEKADHQRVRRIVDLLIALAQLQPEMVNGPFEFAEDELDRALSDYTWTVAAGFTGGKLRIGFQPHGGTAWEGSAVSWLVQLAETEEVGRLRSCKTCKRLFYAVRKDKAFCGAICKTKAYDSDPEHHATRLKRLRENYASPAAKRKRRKAKRKSD